MSSPWRDDFGPFEGRVWINCSHQGPLPRVAADAAREAIRWKVAPHRLTPERFQGVPHRLRKALGTLIGVPPEEVILANSSSYGLHLLANGIRWRAGDEVLLVAGDFPSTLLPWMGLASRGVETRFVKPRGPVLSAAEVAEQLRPATRVVCTTWVHSLTGGAVDLHAVGAVCRERGVVFVVNGSQGVGARPLDLASTPVDALTSVGFKWLCGPYGTGFGWVRPSLLEELDYNQAYWLAQQTADDLGSQPEIPTIATGLGARKYDVFGTACFFNYVPWTASVEYILEQGVSNIAAHDGRLVGRLIEGLDHLGYRLISPRGEDERTTLVLAQHREDSRTREIQETLTRKGIYTAYRRGAIRFSPHLYNGDSDIDRALEVLEAAG